MQKTWNWKFAIRAAAAAIPGFIFVLMPLELWSALIAPQEYPFAAQGPAAAMWTYQSQAHYVISGVTLWITSGIAAWALVAKQASRLSRLMWSGPFVLVWALLALDGTRLV